MLHYPQRVVDKGARGQPAVLYDELLDELRNRAAQAGSERKVAEELAVDPATLNRWLKGRTKQANLSHMLAVAERLGWSKTRRNALVDEFTAQQSSRAGLESRLADLEERVKALDARLDGIIAELHDDLATRVTRPRRR